MGIPVIEASHTKKIQALTDILVSISLEEAAIAHILNAEGEKLQKIIADEQSTTNDLLCANKSVDNLADTLTNLEMLLKSKTRLVLNDKCYAQFCDEYEDRCKHFRLRLESEDAPIIPIGPNEYNLVVGPNITTADVTVTTLPPLPVAITIIEDTNVTASALLNVITITQTTTPFEGTVTALLTLPNGCKRKITIHVIQQTIPCPEFQLVFTTTNGTITPVVPGIEYNFNVTNAAVDATIKLSTNPASEVTITGLILVGDVDVTLDPTDTLNIASPIEQGAIAAVVAFGEGCQRNILINIVTAD
jgi:hypothetical protein